MEKQTFGAQRAECYTVKRVEYHLTHLSSQTSTCTIKENISSAIKSTGQQFYGNTTQCFLGLNTKSEHVTTTNHRNRTCAVALTSPRGEGVDRSRHDYVKTSLGSWTCVCCCIPVTPAAPPGLYTQNS
jgi:hypothetical protein